MFTVRVKLEKNFQIYPSEELHLFHTLARLCYEPVILVSSRHDIRRLALPLDSHFSVDVVADYLEYFMSFEFDKDWERSKSLNIARRILTNPELQQTEYNSIDPLHHISYEELIPFLKKNAAQNHTIREYWETVEKIQDRLKDDHCQYFLSLNFKVLETDPTKLLEIGLIYSTQNSLSVKDYKSVAKHYVIKEHEHLKNKKYVQSRTKSFVFGETETIKLEYALLSLYYYFSVGMHHSDDFYVVVFGSHIHLRHFGELKVPKEVKNIHKRIYSYFDENRCDTLQPKANIWDVMKKHREFHREDKFSSLETVYNQYYADSFDEANVLGNAGNDAAATIRIFKKQIFKNL